MNFVWAIHPGKDIKWNDEDRANLIGKAAFDSQTLINMIYDEKNPVTYTFFDCLGIVVHIKRTGI